MQASEGAGYMICKSAHPGSIPGVASNHFKEYQRDTICLDVTGARVAQGAWDKIRDSVILAVMAMWLASPAEAKTIYVSVTGDDTANGFSANEPLLTIRAAVLLADSGDDISLAQGVYEDDEIIRIEKSLSFQSPVQSTQMGIKFRVLAGAEVTFRDVTLVNRAVPVGAQISVDNASVWMTDIVATVSGGIDSLVSSRNSAVYLTGNNKAVAINYGASAAKEVIQTFYGSYLHIGPNDATSFVITCKTRCVYAASSVVVFLGGIMGGIGSTPDLIAMNRMSRLFVNPVAVLRSAVKGIILTNGSDAYVPPEVLFSAVTTPKYAVSGGKFITP